VLLDTLTDDELANGFNPRPVDAHLELEQLVGQVGREIVALAWAIARADLAERVAPAVQLLDESSEGVMRFALAS
jgi:hypothetical protein